MLYDENNNYFDIVSNELEYEDAINKYVDKSKYNDLIVCHLSFRRRSNVYNSGCRFQHNPHECL